MRALRSVAFVVLVSSGAAAEPATEDSLPSYTLPAIEVRADPISDPLGPLPLSTHRVGRDALERRPGGHLGDVLTPIAGLRIASTGAPFASSAISVRGSSSEQVLVLVDGRRRNSAQGGGVDLAAMPLDTVEEVEVLRGGASALWGSAALGGAILVRTREPEPGSSRVRVGGGSFGMRSISGDGSLALGERWTALGAGSFFDTEGDYAFEHERSGASDVVRNGDVRRLTGELRVGGPVASGLALTLDAEGARVERGVPGSVEFPSPSARLEYERSAVGVRAEEQTPGAWQRSFDLSYLRTDQRYREPAAPFGRIDDSHRNVRWRGEAGLARVGGATALRFAGGASLDRLASSTDGDRERRAAELRLQLGHDRRVGTRTARAMAAARLDLVESFAPAFSPRVGASLELVPERLTLRGSWGLSFRTPSFDDLFWPPRATAAGNPDLKVERGRDLDVGLAFELPRFAARAGVEAFVRSVDDLIQWIPGASGIWRPHNVGSARITGIEADAGFTVALPGGIDGRLTGQFTFLDSEDRTGEPNVDGKDLVYRPRVSGGAQLLLRRAGFGELETSWRFVDDVYVTRANTKTLPGYALGEVRYRRPLSGALSADVSVTNLLDTRARDFRDYPLPGRALNLGLTWKGGPR